MESFHRQITCLEQSLTSQKMQYVPGKEHPEVKKSTGVRERVMKKGPQKVKVRDWTSSCGQWSR